MTAFHLVFNGILTTQSGNALRGRMVQILERQDCESLTVVLTSDGGSNNESLALYNFIRNLPAPIHIHAAGQVGSAAVPLFLAGTKRTCTPTSRFFFHAADFTFPPGGQQIDRIAEAMMLLDDDGKLAHKIVSERAKIPKKTLDTLYGRNPTPTLISAEQAVTWGIVDEIVELNPGGEIKPGVAVWMVQW